MNTHVINRKTRSAKQSLAAALMLGAALSLPLGNAQAFSQESFDPNIHLPANQSVQVATELLSLNLSNAFERVLNSAGDKITLNIEGNIEFPIPIPYVPPGIFNGGVQVAVTPEIKRVARETGGADYYEVSLKRAQGISFGASLPDMPDGTDVSVSETLSQSTVETFRFNTPADVARGIVHYMLLKGLWEEMREWQSMGLDTHEAADMVLTLRGYFADLTGIDFRLDRDEVLAALQAAKLSLQAAEKGVAVAGAVLAQADKAYGAADYANRVAKQRLSAAQRRVNSARASLNACKRFCYPKRVALNVASRALSVARTVANNRNARLSVAVSAVEKARDAEQLATTQLNAARAAVEQTQQQVARLPEDTALDFFGIAVNKLTSALDFLDQSYQGFEVEYSKESAIEASASCYLGGGLNRGRALKVSVNELEDSLSIGFSAQRDSAVHANLPGSVKTAGVELKSGAGVEYELVFVRNKDTQRYEVKDLGNLKVLVGLAGIASKGYQLCTSPFSFDVKALAGAAVTPTLEIKLGHQASELASRLQGVVDLSALINTVLAFPNIDGHALFEATTATMNSLDVDQLLDAIGQVQPLPLKISFNRSAGIRAGVKGGSDKVLKGGVKLSAVWTDFGTPIDLSDLTVADFVSRIIEGGEGLVDSSASLVDIILKAQQEMDAAF